MNSHSKSIALNVFHIVIVSSLICSLAKRIQPGNELLKKTAYGFVLVMVVYHSYIIWMKIH